MADKQMRGFARLSPERRSEVASMGGRKAQEKGKAHRWTTEEARAAGSKGGTVASKNRREADKVWYEKTFGRS